MKACRKLHLVYGLLVLMVFATLSPGVCAASVPLSDYGIPLSDEEMAELDGEWGHIVSGALTGAVTSAFAYATGSEDHSLKGLASAAAEGAAWGAVGGAMSSVRAVATGASLAFNAAETAWSCFAGANLGALQGAVSQITRHLNRR